MTKRERVFAITIAAVALVMRAVAFSRYQFDSDEPQHLHVAWGWTAGLLQYRDLFDNHAPLFHILAAQYLRLFGERPDILLFMRVPMIPLWLVVSICLFAIGRRLYDVRVAIWATLLANVFPPFFLKSLEFRTDNLWNTLWIVAVAMLTLGPRSAGFFFMAGLVLGCAMAVSIKTTLLLTTLAAAGVITYYFALTERRTAITVRHLVALAAGIVIVPAAVAAYFVSRGAWSDLVYCVFTFNGVVARTRSPIVIWLPRLLSIPLLIILIRVAMRYRGTTTALRYFFGVATAFFVIMLYCFWILISPRDLLPFVPFFSIFLVAALARRKSFTQLVVTLALISLISVGYYTDWFRNHTREFITMERQVLRLTRPGDMLMDYKGETIYRRRPYFYILEFITRHAIARGFIADTIPEDLVRTGCHVAQADGLHWPERARDFMNEYFIDVGRLRASGQWLQQNGSFTIGVPGQYVVLSRRGEAAGILDGTPYHGARQLAAGMHFFASSGAEERMACLWAPAYARGFSPFHLQDLDF
jgi:hypothetical protein